MGDGCLMPPVLLAKVYASPLHVHIPRLLSNIYLVISPREKDGESFAWRKSGKRIIFIWWKLFSFEDKLTLVKRFSKFFFQLALLIFTILVSMQHHTIAFP